MSKRVVILGAGPIGVEAALYAAQRGLDVNVYEAEQVGAHVAKWGHVTFFSPWRLNRSPWGEAALREAGQPLGEADVFPTGADYLRQHLRPLARLAPLEGRVHEGAQVIGVARSHALKGQLIAHPDRSAGPFRLLVRRGAQESYVEADLVIDATGAYQHPNAAGLGGLPALGETALGERIWRYIPDITGADAPRFAHRRTLLIGHGYSAATSLRLLHTLAQQAEQTQVDWALHAEQAPYTRLPDDALPQRDALAAFGNDAAAGIIPSITPHPGSSLEAVSALPDGTLCVTLRRGDQRVTLAVDEIIADVGYRPDLSLYRELQVHLCYASEGPMKLAAALLSASGAGGGDCLSQESPGLDTLRSPEPDFFVLGSKSYGRGSAFLLRVGFEQIAQVLDEVAGG